MNIEYLRGNGDNVPPKTRKGAGQKRKKGRGGEKTNRNGTQTTVPGPTSELQHGSAHTHTRTRAPVSRELRVGVRRLEGKAGRVEHHTPPGDIEYISPHDRPFPTPLLTVPREAGALPLRFLPLPSLPIAFHSRHKTTYSIVGG